MASSFAKVVYGIGRIPVVGGLLRRAARAYRDGSVVTVPAGQAAGLRWVRHHRYVSGYHLGIYEPKIQQALAGELRPGQTFYDVGANAGFCTLIGSRLVGPEGKVFSFEPLPGNADVIEEQLAVNGIENVLIVRSAVMSKSGEERLLITGSSSTPRIASDADVGSLASMTVPVCSLDDFVKNHPAPDFVKIDIEGAEADALEGSDRLIAQHHPTFLIELHGEDVARRVTGFLERRDYVVSRLDGQPLPVSGYTHHILARKGPQEGQ